MSFLRRLNFRTAIFAVLLSSLTWAGSSPEIVESRVLALLEPSPRFDDLKELGPDILPLLAKIYESSPPEKRVDIARVFYRLGWESAEARRALMKDVHTQDQNLRLEAQWALGRVSHDDIVVDILLDNMQNDSNPLFRDKAACALAYDQIHLTARQKLHLFERLVEALRDPKLQVRSIALQALQIHTGQTKDFRPDAPDAEREERIREWTRWLDDYRSSL
jgi:HEAT repeat protein